MSSNISDHIPQSRPRGRPRGFNKATALDAAMRVFWTHGYAGASIGMLSDAMNVPRATLYQLFGDKGGLFKAAVAHYGEVSFASVMDKLEGSGDVHADLNGFFTELIDFATRDPETLGCLIAVALADAAGSNKNMRDMLAGRFGMVENTLKERLQRAQDKGQIPASPNADDLAMMLAATARGLMVRARTGCAAEEMYPAARTVVDLCCGK